MAKKVFLLDAMALVFRAYYALIRSPRVTSKGKNTNAQFGFTNTIIAYDKVNLWAKDQLFIHMITKIPYYQ